MSDRQITGALIKKDALQEKLRKIVNAFKYVKATGVKVGADTLQIYEQVRKKVAKQLSTCIRFLQAQKAKTPEESQERTDALQKVHSITNWFTPSKLETLSKQTIEKSDKRALKVPSHGHISIV